MRVKDPGGESLAKAMGSVRLEWLSWGECLALVRRAAAACTSRLEAIAENARPDDRALRGLLAELASDARSRQDAARGFELVHAGAPESVDSALAAEILRHYFPSLQTRFGEGYLSRDAAMYFAERVEEEASRLYRALANAASDERQRLFLERAALGERGHLERLRTVLL